MNSRQKLIFGTEYESKKTNSLPNVFFIVDTTGQCQFYSEKLVFSLDNKKLGTIVYNF